MSLSNTLAFPFPSFRAFLDAIGEMLNDIGGVRFTRFTRDHAAGETDIDVETVFGWPTAGTFYVGLRKYSYAAVQVLPPQLQTVVDVESGAAGLIDPFRSLTPLADASETFSALDVARNMLFADTAEGEFLDVLADSYGIARRFLSDAQLQSLVQTLAFAPRGTIYALEQVLDLLVGAANYEIFEDLVNFPNRIFINFDPTLSETEPKGKAFFNAKEELATSSTTTATVADAPIGGDEDSVTGIFLAPDEADASFEATLPSAETPAWTYSGTIAEGTAWADAGGGVYTMDTTGPGTSIYTRAARINPWSDFEVVWVADVTSGGASNEGCMVKVQDGERDIAVNLTNGNVVEFVDVGVPSQISGASISAGVHEFKLRRINTTANPANSLVQLFVDDVLTLEESVFSFEPAATRQFQFGDFDAAVATVADWHFIRFEVSSFKRNYWNHVNLGADGTSSSADPDRITSSGSNFSVTLDADRTIRVSESASAHGRNNGTYQIQGAPAVGFADVLGVQHTAENLQDMGEVIGADRFRISPNWDEFTAEDAGEQAVLTTGTPGAFNEIFWTAVYGGDHGDNIAIQFIHATPAAVQVAVVDPGSGFDEEIEITLDPLVHDASDVLTAVAANSTAAALVTAVLGDGSGSGAPTVLAATNLAGGEDGKTLTIGGSLLGVPNNGNYPISTLIDSRTVLLGTHRAPADPQSLSAPSLQDETLLDWRKDPNFATDVMGFRWETVAAGSVAGAVLTFRDAVPSSPIDIIATYTTVLSAQVLRNSFVPSLNSAYFPFYLFAAFAEVQRLVEEDLTVAGVIPLFN